MKLTKSRKKQLIAEYFEKKRVARRNKIVWFVGLILALLLASLRCSCSTPLPKGNGGTANPKSSAGESHSSDDIISEDREAGLTRKTFPKMQATEAHWMQEMRAQASMRAKHLQGCLGKSSSPGAVRWKFLLNPTTGETSSSEFEGMNDTADPGASQIACFVRILSETPYLLSPNAQGSVPISVSLMIQF